MSSGALPWAWAHANASQTYVFFAVLFSAWGLLGAPKGNVSRKESKLVAAGKVVQVFYTCIPLRLRFYGFISGWCVNDKPSRRRTGVRQTRDQSNTGSVSDYQGPPWRRTAFENKCVIYCSAIKLVVRIHLQSRKPKTNTAAHQEKNRFRQCQTQTTDHGSPASEWTLIVDSTAGTWISLNSVTP